MALRIPRRRGGPYGATQPFVVHCLDQEGQVRAKPERGALLDALDGSARVSVGCLMPQSRDRKHLNMPGPPIWSS